MCIILIQKLANRLHSAIPYLHYEQQVKKETNACKQAALRGFNLVK